LPRSLDQPSDPAFGRAADRLGDAVSKSFFMSFMNFMVNALLHGLHG
jgi:hypothetical protein